MPLRAIVTSATQADCSQAGALINGLKAEHLIADKGYDSDAIVHKAQEQNIQPQIPPVKTVNSNAFTINICIASDTW